uniref:Uncharacterized protein n=1 Tax=Chlamydomonas euryale TaxID=1486919 RepID=A0A7R9Z2N3_9CHLO
MPLFAQCRPPTDLLPRLPLPSAEAPRPTCCPRLPLPSAGPPAETCCPCLCLPSATLSKKRQQQSELLPPPSFAMQTREQVRQTLELTIARGQNNLALASKLEAIIGRLQKSLSTSADGTDAGGGGAAAAGSADVGGSVAPADSVTWCRTTASYRLALSAPRAAGPLFEIERQHPLFEFERKAADWPEVRAEGAPSSAEQGTASAAAAASGTASLPADPPVDPPAAGAASRQLLAPGSYAGGASPANSVQLLLGGSVSALLQNEASSGADSKVGATSDGGSTSSDGSGTAAGRGVASAANHPCDTSDSGRLLDGAMSGSAPSSGTQGAGGALGGVHSTASVSSWEELRPHLRRCVQRLLHDGGGGRASGEARVAQQGTLPIAGELEALIDALRLLNS